jgi:hypothetical protein
MKYLLIALLLLTSCTTAKRCTAKFPPQTITIVKDSIREKITYRDTTIFVTLPAKIVTVKDTVYVKNGVVSFRPVTAESNLATASAWISNNNISLTLADKDTTLIITLSNALRNAEFWQSKYEKDQKTVNVPYTPKFWKITGWVGIITILLLLLFIGVKLRKVLPI